MKPTDVELLLWEMSRGSAEEDIAAAADELLLAYQAGELPADDAAGVESVLEQSRPARERLAELAGVECDQAPARVRRRLFGENHPNNNAGNRLGRSWWQLAAAAALVATLGGFAWRQLALPEPADAISFGALEFDVSAVAVAWSRSGDDSSRTQEQIEAYADTEVQFRVEARDAVPGTFALTIYRADGGELYRVEQGLEHEQFQGAASVKGSARQFAGSERAGDHQLFLVVGSADDLPATIEVAAGSRPLELLSAPNRRVFTSSLRLLAPAAPTENR